MQNALDAYKPFKQIWILVFLFAHCRLNIFFWPCASWEVSFFRTLLHTTFPKIKFPLICQLLLLILGTIAPRFFLEPGLVEMAFMASTSLCLALLFLVLWKLVIRSRTTLNLKLQTYEHIRREDGHRKTKEVMRGPSRGIRVWKILDLYEHFQALIRDRNMYYLDPNIIRPLTASVRLSFSELVGPDQAGMTVVERGSRWCGRSRKLVSRH